MFAKTILRGQTYKSIRLGSYLFVSRFVVVLSFSAKKKSRAAVGWLTFYRISKTKHFYGIPVYHEQNTVYRAFSHNVTAAILVFQNNQTAAILLFQTSLVAVELFSYVNVFFWSNKFASYFSFPLGFH